MKITLAIISYNAQEHIEQCIESCIKQTYKDIEVLIVDDNSSDNTAKIIKKMQKRDRRIRFIQHTENKSALQARKTAIKNATSEYVWLIDSDDRVDDLGAVGLLVREVKKQNFPDMVCFGSNDYYDNGELKRVFYDWGRDKPLNNWKIDSDFRPYTRITKKSVLEKAIEVIPDDLYLYRHNDLFMFCLVKLCTASRVFFEKPLYRYMLSPTSVTNQKDLASISKHIELIESLMANYTEVAEKLEQTDIHIRDFVESERKKLIKYAINQYKGEPITYLHALKKIYKSDNKVIISLTTYNKRIQTVDKVINSLLNQSIAVDKIILWLDENETSREKLPAQLLALESGRFEIKFCPNYKSYKKLIPTLELYPNATIITFDDDMEYPSDQVEKLLVTHFDNPQEVVANVARNILVDNGKLQPYSSWVHAFEEQVGKPLSSLLPIGVGGVLYPPGALNEEVSNVDAFLKFAPHGDDLWFKCMTLLNNRKVIVTGDGFKLGKCQLDGTADIGLWQSVNEGTDSNYDQLMAIANNYLNVNAKLICDSFNHFEVTQANLLTFYTSLRDIKKHSKKEVSKQIFDTVQNLEIAELHESHNELPLSITIDDVVLNKELTPFAQANQLARQGEYEKAAVIYNELAKQSPEFKYYRINFELMMERIK